MSCGKYQLTRRDGTPVGVSVMHDDFAQGFSTVERLSDHPCPEDPATPGPLAKAVSWIRAEASRVLEGDVPEDQYQARLEACRACPKLQPSSPLGHCGACGCGTRRRAELTIKAKMPRATCPLGNW
jgi:hypothetical protein